MIFGKVLLLMLMVSPRKATEAIADVKPVSGGAHRLHPRVGVVVVVTCVVDAVWLVVVLLELLDVVEAMVTVTVLVVGV